MRVIMTFQSDSRAARDDRPTAVLFERLKKGYRTGRGGSVSFG
jgi:hypothetical protein